MAEKEQQKWYNSRFFSRIGEGVAIGAVILALASGIRRCDGPTNNDVEIEKARAGYMLQERDLNNNGISEKFYKINEKKYFSEIDGKNLEDSLRE